MKKMNHLFDSPSRRETYYGKILLISGFCMILYIFLNLFLYHPGGYVVDIYSVLPPPFYFSFILCFLIGSLAVLFTYGIIRKLGILLLILTHTAILVIPYMFGYFSMGRADDMSYIGEYLQIVQSGHISYLNIYPASHIIGATTSLVTGLAPNIVAFILPFIFSVLFIGGLVLCCRLFIVEQDPVNIAIPASFILYLGPYNFLNVPHALFFSLMPLTLYIIMRTVGSPSSPNFSLLVPLVFLVPFTHPFIVLFVVIIMAFFIIGEQLLNKFIEGNYRRVIMPLLVVSTGFLSWFMYNNTLNRQARAVSNTYAIGGVEPVFFETTEKMTKINIDLFKIVKLLFVYYGRYTIPLIIITITFILVYKQRRSISRFLKARVIFLMLFFLVLLGVEVILFLNPLISHQPDRLTNLLFIVYAQVPLFAIALSLILPERKILNLGAVLLLLVLVGTWGFSFYGMFNSPNIYRQSDALTYNEVEGMHWYYDTRDNENVIAPLSQIKRFHTLFGELQGGSLDNQIYIPDHFGYINDNVSSFAGNILDPGLNASIIVLTFDELRYLKVPGYIEVGRYTANDYVRFRSDTSVSGKVFDTTDVEIYYV